MIKVIDRVESYHLRALKVVMWCASIATDRYIGRALEYTESENITPIACKMGPGAYQNSNSRLQTTWLIRHCHFLEVQTNCDYFLKNKYNVHGHLKSRKMASKDGK